ncbi:HAMP domain-containing histidine kinase [Microbacterium sp. Au-Mic1]|uniref:sensor histidine kinase n=1 Tax=Microbacterium sp. Au-Mic1 TaxID=2906457 RepID=UPI001E3190A4|nr:HAMP domain-containing sensor histidine kinase [Microbacterium sp. Au-Mic1]MCE4026552.1 HAMP domain-containing histidine kinase [Microbacterium sp. Au-Mic1]
MNAGGPGRAASAVGGRGGRASRPLWWFLAAAPAVLGAAIAAVLAAAGDLRQVQVRIALPAVAAGAGILLSVIALGVLAVIAVRTRRRVRAQIALDAAMARGAAQERQHHARFLARLDHELKNPLTAILATSAAAQNNVGGAESWPIVDAQAAKLGALVRDLRKLADLESRPLEREPVDLEQLLVEAIAALAQQDPASGARMALTVTRVPWPVPPISADLDLLSLAVDNVLGNAAKYSESGPIEVRLREEAGQAVIDVADTGRGIPESDLPQVFDELARAQNARDVAGSGIGLSLVAAILRRHGGAVALRSAEDSGTVVTLRLPLA